MQGLVAEAANSSRYDEIDRLTAVALSLNEMALGVASAQRLDQLATGRELPGCRAIPAVSRQKADTQERLSEILA